MLAHGFLESGFHLDLVGGIDAFVMAACSACAAYISIRVSTEVPFHLIISHRSSV